MFGAFLLGCAHVTIYDRFLTRFAVACEEFVT
jgi:hypothetical protein